MTMVLQYLAQEGIDDIKINFSKYKRHFSDQSNQWFIKTFQENGWWKDLKFQCEDLRLDQNEDYNISDRRNIEILYTGWRDLSPALAADERVWAGALFGPFWNYVKYRRAAEISSGDEQAIKNSFFFMRSTKRSCFMNCLSRLWWTGHLIYDAKAKNHFRAADLLCDGAYASTILLFSSSNFTANKDVALGVLDRLAIRKSLGDEIGRYHYVEVNRYLNSIGSVTLLDTLTRDEASQLTGKTLDRHFGAYPPVLNTDALASIL